MAWFDLDTTGLDQLDAGIARQIEQSPIRLQNICAELADAVTDQHLDQIATLYALSDDVEPGNIEVRESADGCVVALSEETARWLFRYLDDGGYADSAAESPRRLRVELQATGTGRRVDDAEAEALLRQPNVFERPLGDNVNPRVKHLPPGIYREIRGKRRLDMLVAYIPSTRENRHYHFGETSTLAIETALPDAVERWCQW